MQILGDLVHGIDDLSESDRYTFFDFFTFSHIFGVFVPIFKVFSHFYVYPLCF